MDKPEALLLAEVMSLAFPGNLGIDKAAAELRRLHEANEAFGKRQEWWNEKMFALEQQRDALLEALKEVVPLLEEVLEITDDPEPGSIGHKARAAIKAVEGENT